MKQGLTIALWTLLGVELGTMAKADKVDDYLKMAMGKHHIPSISVAIVRKGKIEKLKSYGVANLEWNGSATKPFVGIALMQLVEEGKIALEDKVSAYLPEAPAAWNAITIHHLATHTSGIASPPAEAKIGSLEEAIQQTFTASLEYAPGEKADYGIGDSIVLMKIMEKVAGKPFPEILRERLFEPLHMTATRFDNEVQDGPCTLADLLPHRASIYYWKDGVQKIDHFLYPTWTYAAGGLYASISDLAKWALALDEGAPVDEFHLCEDVDVTKTQGRNGLPFRDWLDCRAVPGGYASRA